MWPKDKIIIAVGDLHQPFVSWPWLQWLIDTIITPNKRRIYAVVQMGDLYDMFAYTKFPARKDMSAKDELEFGRQNAEVFWTRVQKACGYKTKYFQLLGNHDIRPPKRMLEQFPEGLAYFKDDVSLWEFRGVESYLDTKEPLEILGWLYTHGHTKNGKHSEAVHFQNVVTAHTHTGGLWCYRFHRQNETQIVTELGCGYGANPFAPELIYRPLTKYFKWTHGVGIIDGYGGRFVPYNGEI